MALAGWLQDCLIEADEAFEVGLLAAGKQLAAEFSRVPAASDPPA